MWPPCLFCHNFPRFSPRTVQICTATLERWRPRRHSPGRTQKQERKNVGKLNGRVVESELRLADGDGYLVGALADVLGAVDGLEVALEI